MGNVAKSAEINLQVFGDSDMDVQEMAIPELFDMESTRPALIIFTSGTTGMLQMH
jgi:acyl-coenzyme A synthetase/AMP-(fatty) acid ligase